MVAFRFRPGTRDNPILAQAYADAERLGIPQLAYLRFRQQVWSAASRGIGWEFTLPAWWAWWQFDDRWARRGTRRDQLVMARFGDAGPYAARNVHAVNPAGNVADRTRERVVASNKLGRQTREARGNPLGIHLRVRGDGHPRSQAIVTPAGRFGSIALAAEHYGITRQGAGARVRRGAAGWRYE